MPIIEEIDSGIDASSSNSREDSPSNKKTDMISKMIEEDDDDMDETMSERLWGLTEMFPETLRNLTSAVFHGTVFSVKSMYSFSRSAAWIFFSSSAILIAPVIFEVKRTQLEEVQRQQQRQILLGPSAAVGGGGMPGLGGMPMPPQMAQR